MKVDFSRHAGAAKVTVLHRQGAVPVVVAKFARSRNQLGDRDGQEVMHELAQEATVEFGPTGFELALCDLSAPRKPWALWSGEQERNSPSWVVVSRKRAAKVLGLHEQQLRYAPPPYFKDPYPQPKAATP